MSEPKKRGPDERISWLASAPFIMIHLLPLGAFYTGVHWSAWIGLGVLYFLRMWCVTGGYHRYFSHRSYSLSRVMQFLLACGGSTAVQKGVLWWAAHHRHHHKHSDQEHDVHSPKRGFWWSQVGWIVCPKYDETRWELIPDLARYPELVWLNRYHLLPPLLLGTATFGFGWLITGTITGGLGVLFISFFLSTAILAHATFTINSFSHIVGRRRYATSDTSRNNWVLALLTGGEGWHNNHHHYPAATCQGFFWWEIDTTYYLLWLLSKLKIVGNLKRPPKRVLTSQLIKNGAADIGMFDTHWAKPVRALQNTRELAAEQKRNLEELYGATRCRVEEIARLADAAAAESSA